MKTIFFSRPKVAFPLVFYMSFVLIFSASAQNVGIGTDTPTSKLHIYDGNLKLEYNSNPFIYINSLTAGGKAGINIQQNSTSKGWLYYDDLTDVLHLNTSTDGNRYDFTITSAGNVGIGTDDPYVGAKLDVRGDINVQDGSPVIRLKPTGTSQVTAIKFYDVDPIGWIKSDGGTVDKFFLTTEVNGVRYDLNIDPDGNIGIGTDAPNEKLHVEGNIEVDQKIKANDSGGLEFATDEGTTRLFIHDNGNVGIGTSSPGQKLHVEGTIEVDQKIQANDSGGLEFASQEGTTRMVITNGGNVGIGTPGPSTKLHVYGGQIKLESSNPYIRIKPTLADVAAGILMYDNVETTRAKLIYDHDLDHFQLSTDNYGVRDDMIMTSSGMVGLGTSSPGSHQLYVTSSSTGASGSSGYFVNTAASGIAMNIENSSSSSNDNALLVTNRGDGNIASFDSYHGDNTWDREFRFTYDGHGYCDQTWHSGGADYAEIFIKADENEDIQPGDVIAMSPEKEYTIVKADASKNQLVLGVYSTNPAFVGNSPAEDAPENAVLVGLMGVVPTKVCMENGPIKIGDFLTASSMEGIASKAIAPGMAIGRAMENYDGASTGMIKVMVDVSWVEIEDASETEALKAEINELRALLKEVTRQSVN